MWPWKPLYSASRAQSMPEKLVRKSMPALRCVSNLETAKGYPSNTLARRCSHIVISSAAAPNGKVSPLRKRSNNQTIGHAFGRLTPMQTACACHWLQTSPIQSAAAKNNHQQPSSAQNSDNRCNGREQTTQHDDGRCVVCFLH